MLLAAAPLRAQTLLPHPDVRGDAIDAVEIRTRGEPWRSLPWSALGEFPLAPGAYELRLHPAPGATALYVPVCAGRRSVQIGDGDVAAGGPPRVVALPPDAPAVTITIDVSAYERRIACGDSPRAGEAVVSSSGLGILSFDSSHAAQGGGRAALYIPPGHDMRRAGPLLVGLHPWNGSIWTYAAYREVLDEAARRNVVLLFPSGLGNSLYTADAEDETIRAIDALARAMPIDPDAVSIWGASMGGAGATTIAFHHPDRFASVTSFFGDSRYDRSTYAGAILRTDLAAHEVNALDVVDNARHLPVWLIHGDADRTSKITQSAILAAAMKERGFAVRFDRVPGRGHEGALVAEHAREVVDRAAEARVPRAVDRVTYWSVRPDDRGAYGVRIERSSRRGDAFVDVALAADGVHVREARGVRSVRVDRGTFGTDAARPPPIIVDPAASGASAAWSPP